jgi:hypothetical protein
MPLALRLRREPLGPTVLLCICLVLAAWLGGGLSLTATRPAPAAPAADAGGADAP